MDDFEFNKLFGKLLEDEEVGTARQYNVLDNSQNITELRIDGMKLKDNQVDLSVIGTNLKLTSFEANDNLGTTVSNSNLSILKECNSSRMVKKCSQNVHIDLARDFIATSLNKVIGSQNDTNNVQAKDYLPKSRESDA